MIAIIAYSDRAAPKSSVGCGAARVTHILSAVERRMGSRLVLAVDSGGTVVIPSVYLALMGLGDGGCLKFTAIQGGVAIEKADAPDAAD